MTKQEALDLIESKWWEGKTPEEVFLFQINEPRLCMESFGLFQDATEKALKRSVWTHEFASPDSLLREFNGDELAPSMAEIVNKVRRP